MRIYITLLARFALFPERKLVAGALRLGIKIADKELCKPIPKAVEYSLRRALGRGQRDSAMAIYRSIFDGRQP